MTPILIFGAAVRPDGSPSPALHRRVAAAARFGSTRPDAHYIPTGAKGRHGEAESSVMAALLHSFGVAPGAIEEEPTGTDTLSSVRACARLLRARGHAGPVWAATSRFHLPRCVLLLRIAGLAARPVPIGWSDAESPLRRWYWRLREVPAIPYDALLMAWHRARGEG
ncbi:YdcF family protein [Paracraurococcus lichenis]|uniref:YdcF family protein n=1 Tax=Paracraurococcus lichenis TaxID=3064888 RepID=A0ABT9DZ55_9PROT|nr:YdcF family protein [Paracraurococcus sp. LOR1-02]MDO9709180.1 YdcF family protein [Paracraurococcus sp. LOR1-02]